MAKDQYAIGEQVWVNHNNKPKQVKIVCKMRERNYFTYELRGDGYHGWSGPSFIFKTKEEVK